MVPKGHAGIVRPGARYNSPGKFLRLITIQRLASHGVARSDLIEISDSRSLLNYPPVLPSLLIEGRESRQVAMKGKEKTILFFRSEYSNKKKEMARFTNEFSRKKWSKFFFFLAPFFLSFFSARDKQRELERR